MWIMTDDSRSIVNTAYAKSIELEDGDYVGGEPEWYAINIYKNLPSGEFVKSCLGRYTSYDDANGILNKIFIAIGEGEKIFRMPYITPVFDKKYKFGEI